MLPKVACVETTALNPAALRGRWATGGVLVLIRAIELDAELTVAPSGTLFADESAMVPVRLVGPGRVTDVREIAWRRRRWLDWRWRGRIVLLVLLVSLLPGLILPVRLALHLALAGGRLRAAQTEPSDQRGCRTQESAAGGLGDKRPMKSIEPVLFGHDRSFHGCHSVSAGNSRRTGR